MTTPAMRRAALHRELLDADSATAILQRRCGQPVQASRLAPDSIDSDPVCAAQLQARGETVIRRHVRLECGGLILSEAMLWYVASRLPADMARALATTTQPFGTVVRALGLRRTTLSAQICAPGQTHALIHRALLADAAGRPMALVEENYPWALFGPS